MSNRIDALQRMIGIISSWIPKTKRKFFRSGLDRSRSSSSTGSGDQSFDQRWSFNVLWRIPKCADLIDDIFQWENKCQAIVSSHSRWRSVDQELDIIRLLFNPALIPSSTAVVSHSSVGKQMEKFKFSPLPGWSARPAPSAIYSFEGSEMATNLQSIEKAGTKEKNCRVII